MRLRWVVGICCLIGVMAYAVHAQITYRSEKGAPLTHQELDENFHYLEDADTALKAVPFVTMGTTPTLNVECVVATCLLMKGSHAARPAPDPTKAGRLYIYSDTPLGLSRDTGTAWEDVMFDGSMIVGGVSGGGGPAFSMSNVGVGGVGVHKQTVLEVYELRNINAASGDITVTLDAPNNEIDIGLGFNPATQTELDTHTSSTTNVHGIANSANLALITDPRFTNARTPTVHATSHNPGGTDPIDATYATKSYVDAIAQGLDIKDAAAVATTGNITLSGEQTIDGVLTAGVRVLVKNQTTQTQNGLYVSSSGAWVRTVDADTSGEIETMFVFIQQGTTNANTSWALSTDPPITLGTTNLVYTQFSGTAEVNAGAGLSKSGTTLNVGAGGCITVGVDDVGVTSGCLTATQVQTATAAGLADVNAVGTAATLARSDHTHKRDVRVAKEGMSITTRNRINFIEGLNTTITVDDDMVNDEVDVTIEATQTGLPAGASGDQFLKQNAGNTAQEWASIEGTDNHIDVTFAPGLVTLSTPQSTAPSFSPTYAGMTLNQGGLAASTPITHTAAFNNAGVIFVGETHDYTDTASAADSILARWRVGGVEKASIRKDGRVFAPSLRTNLVTVTSHYTLAGDVTYVMCDATSGAITITLSTVSLRGTGSPVWIKKIDSSANHCTISRSGSDTIEGSTTLPLQIQYQGHHLVPAGANLWVVFAH